MAASSLSCLGPSSGLGACYRLPRVYVDFPISPGLLFRAGEPLPLLLGNLNVHHPAALRQHSLQPFDLELQASVLLKQVSVELRQFPVYARRFEMLVQKGLCRWRMA